ncbi:MAG: hypothetical protein IID31_13695 [Planctomycetes bacterium]|nr:hypothetical protein [Planctomycetota bacterium]
MLYAAGRIAIRPEGGLPAPTVTPREALAAAQTHPTGRPLTAWSDPELVAIYDDPPRGSAEAYPAWKCIGSGSAGAAFQSHTFYVHALTGEVVRTHSNILDAFDITGTVTANATPAISNVDPDKLGPNTLALSNLWANCPNEPAPADLSNVLMLAYNSQTQALIASAYTDSNGNYTLDVPDTMVVDIEAHLVGPMWSVLDGSVVPIGEPLDPQVKTNITAPNTVDFEFNPSPTNEEETAFVDAHFQIDRTLQYLDLWDAEALPDVPLVVNSFQLACNAQYLLPGPDGPPPPGVLRFSPSITSCANTAYSTWIAHEYGHFVLIQLLGIEVNFDADAFHEGFGDTLAHLVYDTEIIGQDYALGCGGHRRTPLVVTPTHPFPSYPICPSLNCLFEHCRGELLSASWLLILQEMRDRYPQGTVGLDKTRALHLDWIYLAQVPDRATCIGIGEIPQSADEGTLIEVLIADDDDDTLANGTPHCQQILAAFGAVNITPSFQINCGDDGLNGSGRTCYADFDESTGAGVLDIFDYLAFQNLFLESDLQACDCDTSSGPGVCDVLDFICFQAAFAAGCEKE